MSTFKFSYFWHTVSHSIVCSFFCNLHLLHAVETCVFHMKYMQLLVVLCFICLSVHCGSICVFWASNFFFFVFSRHSYRRGYLLWVSSFRPPFHILCWSPLWYMHMSADVAQWIDIRRKKKCLSQHSFCIQIKCNNHCYYCLLVFGLLCLVANTTTL